jgi:hypothetical protein
MKRDPIKRFFDVADSSKNVTDASLDDRFPTEDLLTRLRNAVEPEPARKFRCRLLHRTTVISIVAVLAVAGTAAAVAFLSSPVADTSTLSCYNQVSLTSHVIEVVPFSSHPLSACDTALHWKQVPESPSPTGSLCILSNGTLAGFPPSKRADVCAYLKLPTYDGRATNPHVDEFEKAAVHYFGERPCIPPETARSEVLRLLAMFELKHWHVRFNRTRSAKACETLAIQVKSHVVELVGLFEKLKIR